LAASSVIGAALSCILCRRFTGAEIGMAHSDGATDGSSEPGKATAAAGRAARVGWCEVVPGAVLAAIAALALFSGLGLPVGTGPNPGPGAMLDVVAVLLFILGIVVAVEGYSQRQIGGAE
jgi:hypothetical protein